MRPTRAADILSRVGPVTAAAGLRADPGLGDMLPRQIDPAFREQVIRHL